MALLSTSLPSLPVAPHLICCSGKKVTLAMDPKNSSEDGNFSSDWENDLSTGSEWKTTLVSSLFRFQDLFNNLLLLLDGDRENGAQTPELPLRPG